MARFEGQIISVTGGGSGIGEAIVKRLASEGAHVAILDVDLPGAERVAAEVANVSVYHADVADAGAMVEAFAKLHADKGRLDGCVNNAGVGGPFVPIADYPLDWWAKVVSINLNGVFHSLRAQLPHLIASGGGAIVNMSSICGLVGQAGTAGYVATKHRGDRADQDGCA